VISKALDLANISLQNPPSRGLRYQNSQTKDLGTDDFFQWSAGLSHHLGAGLWKARLDVTRREKNREWFVAGLAKEEKPFDSARAGSPPKL
jgi:hypothetical protein